MLILFIYICIYFLNFKTSLHQARQSFCSSSGACFSRFGVPWNPPRLPGDSFQSFRCSPGTRYNRYVAPRRRVLVVCLFHGDAFQLFCSSTGTCFSRFAKKKTTKFKKIRVARKGVFMQIRTARGGCLGNAGLLMGGVFGDYKRKCLLNRSSKNINMVCF